MFYLSSMDFIKFVGFPLFSIFFIILLIKKVNFKNFIIYSIFYFYIIYLLSVAFFPIPLGNFLKENFELAKYVNLIPLNFYKNYEPIKEILRNLILLLPAGFFINLICKNIIFSYKKAFLYGFLISLFIEFFQLVIIYFFGRTFKVFDINDLILNTLGFVLGFCIYKIFEKIIIKNS
ncbi:hypothetical protein DLH72_01540 [Candidatus Gracilibacteria bacterium]|nr:MAG: hypothetical protein DLH72_01540 [Candidatus Gracilibacteria bacterium]